MRNLLPALGLAAATVLAGVTAAPRPAEAYLVFGFGGPFFYGPPVFVPPPVFYAPPVYYPPPAYVAPVPYGAVPPYAAPVAATGPRCYAGLYVCPVGRPMAVGSPCSCPSNAGPQPGTIR